MIFSFIPALSCGESRLGHHWQESHTAGRIAGQLRGITFPSPVSTWRLSLVMWVAAPERVTLLQAIVNVDSGNYEMQSNEMSL
jgi:hypothetical protein